MEDFGGGIDVGEPAVEGGGGGGGGVQVGGVGCVPAIGGAVVLVGEVEKFWRGGRGRREDYYSFVPSSLGVRWGGLGAVMPPRDTVYRRRKAFGVVHAYL